MLNEEAPALLPRHRNDVLTSFSHAVQTRCEYISVRLYFEAEERAQRPLVVRGHKLACAAG